MNISTLGSIDGTIFNIASVISLESWFTSSTNEIGDPRFTTGVMACLIIKSATLASP